MIFKCNEIWDLSIQRKTAPALKMMSKVRNSWKTFIYLTINADTDNSIQVYFSISSIHTSY